MPSVVNVNSFAGNRNWRKPGKNVRQPPVKPAVTVAKIAVLANRRRVGRVDFPQIRDPMLERSTESVAGDGRASHQIGLVYWPRLPSRLTTAITVNQTRQGGPCRKAVEPRASTKVNPPSVKRRHPDLGP